jgi:hypothetical protein
VSAKTYLPIRLVQVLTKPVLRLPAGLTISTSFRFLPATRQNLALVRSLTPTGQGWRRDTLKTFGSKPHVLLLNHGYYQAWDVVFELLVRK